MPLNLKSPRTIVTGLVLIAVIASGLVYSQRDDQDQTHAGYTVARVTRGDIIQAVNTTGQLSPWASVEVSTQISGLVTDVNVDFNSEVKQGQVLAKIDPSTYEQRLRQAQADLAAAEANHTLTALNARRLKGLRDQDLVTQQEYDQADAQLQLSNAGLLTRRAAVENARVDLERCTITSPIDGVVIFKQVEVGKTVVSSFSAPTLFVIAQDLGKMRIIAPISEVDVWSVKPVQAVTFTVDAIPDRRFQGRLTQIRNPYTPSEKQQQQQAQQNPIANFDAVIEVDNHDLLLRPSLTANVSVIVERRANVLRIPNSALRVRLEEGAYTPAKSRDMSTSSRETATVYRLPGGDRDAVPEALAVRLGISDSIDTEVLSGLNEGDVVVTGVASAMDARRLRRIF